MNPVLVDQYPAAEAPATDLEREERRWFSWLSVLHERVSKANSPNGVIVLEIAKKRWLRAREALRRQNDEHHAGAQGAGN